MPTGDVDLLISKLGSSEKAALHLLIDIPSSILSAETRAFLESHPWSGVILFPKNIRDRGSLSSLIGNLQNAAQTTLPGFPFLVAVDEEGGSVSPLEGLISPSPGNMALSATGDAEGTYQLARQNARELRALGFNVNFAPVVDVNSNPQNPIIGIRSFGEQAQTVAEFGAAVIRGYEEEGILATAKHFPGHGDTSKDSHLELPVVDRSLDTLEKIDFLPFLKAIEAGVGGMMTAHVIYPGIDSKPATLSKTILTDLLRKKMGFGGLVFTDSFDMAAIKEHFDLEEAVIDSVKAGADILLALGGRKTVRRIHGILKNAIEKKIITDEEEIPSLKRILSFRKKAGRSISTAPFHPRPGLIEALHANAVTLVSGRECLPLIGKQTALLSPEATPRISLFKRNFPGWSFVRWPWSSASGATAIFFAERRLLSPEVEAALVPISERLECAVSYGNPYLLQKLPRVPIRLTTFHVGEILVKEAARVLLKGEEAHGKLPITL